MKKRKWYKYYVIASWKTKNKLGICYSKQTEIEEFRFIAREDEWITDVIKGILIKECDYDYIKELEIIFFSRERV